MIHLEEPRAYSPAGLGMALYEKVQEVTQGRANKAAAYLSALTCLELDGRKLPDAAWCTLALVSLADLARHAPRTTLLIRDWEALYENIARRSSDASAKQMAEALAWAMSRSRNLCLETRHFAIVNDGTLLPTAHRIPEAA